MQEDTGLPDTLITRRLSILFKGIASDWYRDRRNAVGVQSWSFWKKELHNKFGTPNWKRKCMTSFNNDKFVPGVTSPASWVTRQKKRLRAFDPMLDQDSINFKLLSLMDGEISFAVKTSMKADGDCSNLINILEDIVEDTSLGRKKNYKIYES